MKPEQLDMLKSPQDRAKPWRVAAETAAHERECRARYYTQQADKIERGEA